MTSIMDMLVDVPFEDVEENTESVMESENVEETANTIADEKSDEKKTDIFLLTDEEEENNDSNNISSYYTEPLVIQNVKPKEIEKQSPIKTFKSTRSKPVKKSGNNTESENDTDGETVTGRDLSQPEREESPFDPDNPDPNGPKYCHCRWGESGVMVECEECNEWYHDECIGLTEEETYNIETYYCAPCCSSNSDLVTKYKEDPVKLRQQIIDQIRDEEKLNKPKRKKSNIKAETKAIPKRPAKPKSATPIKAATPKTPKTPKTKAPKPKRIAQSEHKETKRNKILNRSIPVKRSYSDDSSSDEDKVAFVICEECGDSFPNKRALVRHSRKHENQTDVKYECDECGKTFNTSKSLRDHEVVHSGVKPFSCMFCGEAFYLMSQLTSHTNSKHLNVRHQCDHCSRSYSNKPSLVTHMKKVHGENEDSD